MTNKIDVNPALAAFADEIEKISTAQRISAQFELDKIASDADLVEKLAQLEAAHRSGQISDQEKEAGVALAKGLWGGLRGAAGAARTALPQLGSRMRNAYTGAAAGAAARGITGTVGQTAHGVMGAAKAFGRGLPKAVGSIGSAARTGAQQSYTAARAAAANAAKPVSGLNTALGAAAIAAPAGMGVGYSMNKGNQSQGY